MSKLTPPAGSPGGRTAPALDGIDHAMLAALTADGRISVRALADRLNISRANAYSRLDRLSRDGVITGFGARLDPHLAGFGTSAYVMVTVEQAAWRTVRAGLRAIPYVEHIALVSGDFDVLLLVRTPDNTALRDVVLERIQAVEGVRGTRTWLIFEETAGAGTPEHHPV
jgi:DNA-binding Lrp family transcriptional regulator